MAAQNKTYLLIFGGSAVLLAAFIIIAATSLVHNDPFQTGTPLFGDYYFTKITPPVWVSAALWAGTFLYLLLAVIYTCTTLLRPSSADTYLYYSPPVTPQWTWLCTGLGCALGIAWLYMAAAEQLLWQSTLVLLLADLAGGYSAFTLAAFSLQKHKAPIIELDRSAHLGLTVALVHNALAMFALWLWVVVIWNVAASLTYLWGVAMDNACYVGLAIYFFDLVFFTYGDNYFWYEKRKHIYTHYIVYMIYYAGILSHYMYVPVDGVAIFTVVLLFLTVTSLGFKITRTCKKNSEKTHAAFGRKKKMKSAMMQKEREVELILVSPSAAGGSVGERGVAMETPIMIQRPQMLAQPTGVYQPARTGQTTQAFAGPLPPPSQPLLVTNRYHHKPYNYHHGNYHPGSAVPQQMVITGGAPISSFYTSQIY